MLKVLCMDLWLNEGYTSESLNLQAVMTWELCDPVGEWGPHTLVLL